MEELLLLLVGPKGEGVREVIEVGIDDEEPLLPEEELLLDDEEALEEELDEDDENEFALGSPVTRPCADCGRGSSLGVMLRLGLFGRAEPCEVRPSVALVTTVVTGGVGGSGRVVVGIVTFIKTY